MYQTHEQLRDRIAQLRAEARTALAEHNCVLFEEMRENKVLRMENAVLRKVLERFLETTEGEDAVSGMALHGPITLARAALRQCAGRLGQEPPAGGSPQAE